MLRIYALVISSLLANTVGALDGIGAISSDVSNTSHLGRESPVSQNNATNFSYLNGKYAFVVLTDKRIKSKISKILGKEELKRFKIYLSVSTPFVTDGRFYVSKGFAGKYCTDGACGEGIVIADSDDGTITLISLDQNLDGHVSVHGNKKNLEEIKSRIILDEISCTTLDVIDKKICSGHEGGNLANLADSSASTTSTAITLNPSQPASTNSNHSYTSPASETGLFPGLVYLIIAVGIFFVPSFVANTRKHKNSVPIALANIIFGWTGIGWIICFIWAFSSNTRINGNELKVSIAQEPKSDVKKCPYCAEEIRKEAVFCRFCGNEVKRA